MNPFDLPPVGPPVTFDAAPAETTGPRRGRMALVALLTAGLIGGGIAGVSQLVSADRPDLAAQATDDAGDEPVPPVDDTAPPVDDADGDDGDEPAVPGPEAPSIEGEITLDFGDGDPIVIDLGDVDDGAVERLTECIGVPAFDFSFDVGAWEPGDGPFADGPLFDFDELLEGEGGLAELFDDFSFDVDVEGGPGELGDFGVFDADGSVTITGPDGTSVVDLGDNGSVTVTKDGDDVVISTDGDATVTELTELFGDFGTIFESGSFDEMFDNVFDDDAFDEFVEGLPNFDDLPDIEPLDPEAVQSCIDDVLGR